MTFDKDCNKDYVFRHIKAAESAEDETARNNHLYRAGTQMEVIPADGNHNLTTEQQQEIISAARELTQ